MTHPWFPKYFCHEKEIVKKVPIKFSFQNYILLLQLLQSGQSKCNCLNKIILWHCIIATVNHRGFLQIWRVLDTWSNRIGARNPFSRHHLKQNVKKLWKYNKRKRSSVEYGFSDVFNRFAENKVRELKVPITFEMYANLRCVRYLIF